MLILRSSWKGYKIASVFFFYKVNCNIGLCNWKQHQYLSNEHIAYQFKIASVTWIFAKRWPLFPTMDGSFNQVSKLHDRLRILLKVILFWVLGWTEIRHREHMIQLWSVFVIQHEVHRIGTKYILCLLFQLCCSTRKFQLSSDAFMTNICTLLVCVFFFSICHRRCSMWFLKESNGLHAICVAWILISNGDIIY